MWGSPRRAALDVLMIGWGLGTWLGVNGLYVQLPLLVQRLPEGWALPASMVVAVQLANIGLLLFALLKRLRPRAAESQYIYGLLVIGTLALLLNAFLYPRTVLIGSTDRSLAFLTLTFFAALVGCTSSVLFYPYLRHFRDVYLVTYLIGEGLSGFLPSIIALAQGVGGEPTCVLGPDDSVHQVDPDPRFGITVFLLALTVLSAISLFSFTAIDRWKRFDSERVMPAVANKDEEATALRESLLSPRWLGVLVLMAVLNAFANGVLPSVQSYSCMPYGTQAYHLAVTLGAMANPAACMAGVWLQPMPAKALAAILALNLGPLTYILATALLSPTPPLQHSALGVTLIVVSWVIVSAVVSYSRMWVYVWARVGGARGMRAVGVVTQIGSSLGSLLLFFLVNYTGLFTQYEVCMAPVHSN
ncbi:riboflavin transporter 2 isoform X3 [Hyposmocoma kahamanoa]|nr:riboflavin transporter 2 isoform X3 [Hyposmocoma kahamanoa]